jgi:DNA-binding beta-propeller fold protein YncE
VCNEGEATVTVVDVASREVVTTVDLRELGFSANAKPHHVAVEPDGSHWYVSLIGENRVLKLDRSNELVGQVEMETPGLLALDPASDRLYVGRSMKAVRPPQRIGVVDRSEMTIEEREVFLPRPHAIAVQPEVGWVHTASLATNQIASLPADTEDLQLAELEGPTHTYVQFTLAPGGDRMAVTGQTSGRVFLLDVTEGGSPRPVESLQAGGEPWHPAWTPDGRFVYVPRKAADAVDVVDAGSWRVVATVRGEGLSQPHGSAISPDGRHLFVTSNNLDGSWRPPGWEEDGDDPPGALVVIDTSRREVVDVLTVGHNPTGLGIRTPAR